MSSESGAYYGGHDDDETMSYTDHDATSIEDMGNGSYTDNEPHDTMEHYTDPDSTSFHDMMEHSYDYNSDVLMEHYIDNTSTSMHESSKVYYPKLARGATYDPPSPRRSNMRTTTRSCYQAPSTSRWRADASKMHT